MDEAAFSAELAELRGELERVRLEVAGTTSLRRRLEAAQQQLRRSQEAIERRDVIIREARRQIASLRQDVERARNETLAAQERLADAMGSRWFALRSAAKSARKRPWRWLLVPFKALRRTATPRPEQPAPVAAEPWEPSPAVASRPATPRPVRSLRVAAIVGSELSAALDPECTLVTFGPDVWQAALSDASPHMLLVESDVYGNDGGWQGRLLEPAGELRALVEACRAREIPTVFWNTADPLDLDRWVKTASLFEHVVTVDGDCVPRYAGRGAFTTTNVAMVPAGIQPRIFGPGSAGREARAFFLATQEHVTDARAWAQTETLLVAVEPLGLDVFVPEGVELPGPFGASARPLREARASLYRRYAVGLSGPARGDTKGKIPSRVLEMLASGVAVVAVAAPDVSLLLGSVVAAVTPDAAAETVRDLLGDGARRARVVRDGIAFVLRGHTAADRLAAIATAAGMAVDADAERRTTALTLADEPGDAKTALGWLLAQMRPPDEIVIGTKSFPSDIAGALDAAPARVRVVAQPGGARSERMRELARMASNPLVFVSTSERPRPDALETLALRAPHTTAGVIAFAASERGVECLSDDVDPAIAVARASLVSERGWPDDAETIRRWFREGVSIYGVDPAG